MKSIRTLILMLIDLGIMCAVYTAGYLLTAVTFGDWNEIGRYLINLAIVAVFIFAARTLFRVYLNVWRYANTRAYLDIVISDTLGGALALVVSIVFRKVASIGIWHCIAVVAMITTVTLVSRFIYQLRHKASARRANARDTRIVVAIVGAGQVGALLAEELLRFRASHYRPVCFVDKNVEKVGGRVSGLPVFEENDFIFDKLEELMVQEIFIAIPQLTGEDAENILNYYARSGCKVKLYDFASREDSEPEEGERRVIREFKIEDLLFRRAIDVTNEQTKAFYRGKTVLVTGGGGSIGSELARQIAKCEPKKLIIFDIYENNAYDIQQELIRRYGRELDLAVEIGSVRDRARLDAVFSAYRPNIVFHAAAHKHVPLMEHSNAEAIKNNVAGTYNAADMAEKYGVEKFILISTDKAVNPTNVMGASKRMCEMVVQCRYDSPCAFSAVRFGNVLGSNGSVIPLFKRQIAAGGPITITDKRIIRYFMTIPEASGLVMQAGAMAKCGELFVLDMGKPVKIYDLAENMIKLSGLRPHSDIQIVETGLRPGEKLYEELLIKTEDMYKTENDMIFIERDTPLTRAEVDEKLDILCAAVAAAEQQIAAPSVTEAMMRVVPTFHSPTEVNREAELAPEMQAAFGG